MNFQREGEGWRGSHLAHPVESGDSLRHAGGKARQPGISSTVDQEQREQGEMILTALSHAVRSRQRDLMREAVRKAGCFLLSERGTLAAGEHEPSIITRVACRVRWIELAPTFAWL